MRYALACLFVVAVLLTISFRDSHGVLNPHVKPEPCGSCHTKVPTEAEGRAGDYFLLKDTIDDTCHVCHEKTCCKPGSLHGKNHPSNIDRWDRKLFRRPKSLPLHNGFITCNTCHLHTKPDGPSYMMVRIVKIDGKSIDWSKLCTDCHEGY
ncbi:MAG: hypothetical protein HZB86_01690 [Deltaproteobacteria bacterium]|nr:hypothetical protein [Deltaproteobacteria bacterium]